MSGPTRRGSILILAAGLSLIMAVLALTFFNRMRSESRAVDLVVQDAQARIMLHAALSYIQEASRIGYAEGDPLLPDERYGLTGAAPPPYFHPYGAERFVDHWVPGDKRVDLRYSLEGDPDADKEGGQAPAKEDLEAYFGSYGEDGVERPFDRRSWVGWYTPHHRGLTLSPWHGQETDVLDWWQSYRQAPALWEPRLRSAPAQVAPVDPDPARAGDRAEVAGRDYFDGHRAELTGSWPVGGPPKLFPMHVREEPPYAIYDHLTHVGKYAATLGKSEADGFDTNHQNFSYEVNRAHVYPPGHLLKVNDVDAAFVGTGLEWQDVQGKKVLKRFERFELPDITVPSPSYPDPHLLYHPLDTDASMLVERRADGSLVPSTDVDGGDGNALRWKGQGHVYDFVRDADGAILTFDAAGNPDPDGGHVRLTPRARTDANGSVVTDSSGTPMPVRQDDPRPHTIGRAWFRVWRETHDTFIVTVGAGPSDGWRLREGRIEQRGTEVVARAPCPFQDPEELQAAIDQERRLWYRVCWAPQVRVQRLWLNYSQYCSQGGSIKWIQRLREHEVAALAAQGKDW